MNYPAQQYPQQFPPQPQQQQPVYPQAPPAQYPQQPTQQPVYPQAPPVQQGYGQPAYGAPAPQGYQAPPQQPSVPLAEGSIDAFYNQPSTGGGPSISWTDKMGNQKPIGTTYTGIVARDVTNADVQQQTDFNTRQPKFYRDGRPMFAMKVPLVMQPSEEFPDGEAAWYVKGQARDELTRAMAEAGAQGAPQAGATITVQLVQRKPNRNGMNPSNIVRVTYTPAGGQGTGAPSPAPVQQPHPQQEVYNGPPQQPVQQYAPQAQQAPAPQQAPAQPMQQPVQPQGQQLPPPGVQMDPDKAALLARLTGGAPAPQG